jgi:hypothetical protein
MVHPYIKSKFGQQDTEDETGAPRVMDTGYVDGKLKSAAPISAPQVQNMADVQETAQQAGPGTEIADPSADMAKGFQRGAGGGIGSGLMGAGLSGMLGTAGLTAATGGVAAAGLGMMYLEGKAQAKQAEEEAKAIEAQQRKQNQLAAINQLISVSKGLSVG